MATPDGSAGGHNRGNQSSHTETLSTTQSADYLLLGVRVGDTTHVPSISDGLNLSWSQIPGSPLTVGTGKLYVFQAVATGILVNDLITVSASGNVVMTSASVAFSSYNTNNPLDPNVALPATNLGTGPSTPSQSNISTSAVNAFILQIEADGSGVAQTAGTINGTNTTFFQGATNTLNGNSTIAMQGLFSASILTNATGTLGANVAAATWGVFTIAIANASSTPSKPTLDTNSVAVFTTVTTGLIQGAATVQGSISTSYAKETICLFCVLLNPNAQVTAVKDGQGLNWSVRQIQLGNLYASAYEFWAYSPNQLTNDSLTIYLFSPNNDYTSVSMVFGVVGADTTFPFSLNASGASAQTADTASPSGLASTSEVNDLIVGLLGYGWAGISSVTATVGAGFTLITQQGTNEGSRIPQTQKNISAAAEYQQVSAIQKNLIVNYSLSNIPPGGDWVLLVDSFRPPGQSVIQQSMPQPDSALYLPQGSRSRYLPQG